MSLIIRGILLLGGLLASLLVAREAANYPLVQAMAGILLVVLLLLGLVLLRRR